MMTVDEYVQTKVLPQFQPIVMMLRQLMNATAPDAEELMRYGMPSYKGKRLFAWISQSKDDLIVGFSRGTQFEDTYGLLAGSGKVSRHVRVKSLNAVSKQALEYYIRQALALDKQ